MATKTKKQNRQDATLVNVRAAKKRTASLTQRVKDLERVVTSLSKSVTTLLEYNGLLAD